jgi:hypothetical protein
MSRNRRSAGKPRIAGWQEPPDTIRLWHLDEGATHAAQMWFGGWVPAGARRDGDRSMLLPLDDGRILKIKGAGMRGGPIDFTTLRATGPKALWFDFEGRVGEDVAMGHDAAHPGGATFQQAVTEWNVSRRLVAAGERLPPCLGYGRITKGHRTSWFSVFEWSASIPDERGWPDVAPEAVMARLRMMGETTLRLALDFGLLGFPSAIYDDAGGLIIKDLHPFREASPVTMSQASFVMYLFHALHIKAADARLTAAKSPGLPADVYLHPFHAVLPDVTLADHDDAIDRILLPYMLTPAPDFRVEALVAALRSNRITARLMDLVPPDYARFD